MPSSRSEAGFALNVSPIARGFYMTFENGMAISVQFGSGSYSEHHFANFPGQIVSPPGSIILSDDPKFLKSRDAEIAVFWADGDMYDFGADNVKGHATPDEVGRIIGVIHKLDGKKIPGEDPLGFDVDTDSDDDEDDSECESVREKKIRVGKWTRGIEEE